MKKANSKRLVIDASVARASGGDNATHPEATLTRDFLQAVLTICHKAVMTPAIRDEWEVHQSGFARSWRKSMIARRKLVLTDVEERQDIRAEISSAAATDKQKIAMEKDCHLLDAAIATDLRIVSLDNVARDLYKSKLKMPDVKDVMWVNPVVDAEGLSTWLETGAADKPEYKLSSVN